MARNAVKSQKHSLNPLTEGRLASKLSVSTADDIMACLAFADTVIAFIIMAYIVMAYSCMAYKVWYIVRAYSFMPYIVVA